MTKLEVIMGLLNHLIKALSIVRESSSEYEGNVQIRCASCNSNDLSLDGRETIVCQCCGRRYSLDEARKTMGSYNCLDCIYHSVNLFSEGFAEHCFHWDYKCHPNCAKKRTTPENRWTDANRWD